MIKRWIIFLAKNVEDGTRNIINYLKQRKSKKTESCRAMSTAIWRCVGRS